MTKMAEAQSIILTLLDDGKIHTTDEIHKEISKQSTLADCSPNFIHVVLHNLKTKQEKIKSAGKGLYIKADCASSKENNSQIIPYKAKILKTWSTFYKKNIDNFELSLDMSEQDFHNAKWLYELNKKIEELINNFNY